MLSLFQTILNMFRNKPKDAALLDIALQFVKNASIFRQLTVHDILWGKSTSAVCHVCVCEWVMLVQVPLLCQSRLLASNHNIIFCLKAVISSSSHKRSTQKKYQSLRKYILAPPQLQNCYSNHLPV